MYYAEAAQLSEDILGSVLEWQPPGTGPVAPSRPFGESGPIVPTTANGHTIPAAQCAVEVLSNSLAVLPLSAWQRVESDGIVLYEPAEITRLVPFLENPFDLLDAFSFWGLIFRSYVASGNAFLYKLRDDRGMVRSLVPAVPAAVRLGGPLAFGRMRLERDLTVEYGDTTRTVRAGRDDYIHLHSTAINMRTMLADSPVQGAARDVLSTVSAGIKYQNRAQRDGYRAALGVEIHEELAESENVQQLRAEVEFLVEEGRDVTVLPPGAKFAALGRVSPADLQILEILRWGIEETARIYNCPPRKLYHYQQGLRVTNASQEAQGHDYYQQSILPRIEAVSSCFTEALLTRQERRQGLVLRQDGRSIEAGTYTEQSEAAGRSFADFGTLTRDEARVRMGYAPIGGARGNQILSPKGAPAQPVNNNNEDGDE